MHPVTFKEANLPHISKPVDWKDEDCMPVTAYHGEDPVTTMQPLLYLGMEQLPSGMKVPHFVTAWKPSEEDLKVLNEGGVLYMNMCSGALAPHSISTVFPGPSTPGDYPIYFDAHPKTT